MGWCYNFFMQDLQTVFSRLKNSKKKAQDLAKAWREALVGNQEYQEIKDKMKSLGARKKQVEGSLREQFKEQLTQLEDLKIDLESDEELLSDIAVTKMLKGETVEVEEDGEKYQPVFKVKFKKIN